jgi:Tfp pilus assembly protein PilN
MINLLPPAIKQEVVYSHYNRVVLRYLKLVLVLFVLLAGSLLAGRYYLNQQISHTDADITDKQKQVATYKGLQTQAVSINNRLTAIQSIQKSQAKFSVLLADLAQFMPQGTAIASLTLTGNDKQPVQLTVTAVDYPTALSFRDSIARAPRISAADIQSINPQPLVDGKAGLYNVVVVFAFNPGGAK